MRSNLEPARVVEEIARSVHLREGPPGVQSVLWCLAWRRPKSTKEWAQGCRMPIPVVAAIRGELEQRGFLVPGRRPSITQAGNDLLRRLFGECCDLESRCLVCDGSGLVIPARLAPTLDLFASICAERPVCDVSLDQSHGTPETGIRRALVLIDKGLVLGKRVAFLGDDDLVSLALGLVWQAFRIVPGPTPFVVLDIDERFVSFICSHAGQAGIPVDCRVYDARDPLPADLVGSCHTVVTDPPYTVNGITLFAWRAAELLRREGGDLLLSFADPPPGELMEIEQRLNRQGWVTMDVRPGFNRYIGSAIHAHQSTLRHLRLAAGARPETSPDLCYSLLYTADKRRPGGRYRCTLCLTEVEVGPGGEYETISRLKQNGCPECGNSSFHRYGGDTDTGSLRNRAYREPR